MITMNLADGDRFVALELSRRPTRPAEAILAQVDRYGCQIEVHADTRCARLYLTPAMAKALARAISTEVA